MSDLTQTQYSIALDWLISTGIVVSRPNELALADSIRGVADPSIDEHLFRASIQGLDPSWLVDADILVPDIGQLPQDAIDLAQVFGVPDTTALAAIRQVHGHIDMAERHAVGSAGETQLVGLLEARRPGSTVHVALEHDGLGYDVRLLDSGHEWHLEVKSTTRRGRLTAHLTRNEYQVGMADPAWRLVIIGLDSRLRMAAIATVKRDSIVCSPTDQPNGAQWESARYPLSAIDLEVGLPILGFPKDASEQETLLFAGFGAIEHFAWMPSLETIAMMHDTKSQL